MRSRRDQGRTGPPGPWQDTPGQPGRASRPLAAIRHNTGRRITFTLRERGSDCHNLLDLGTRDEPRLRSSLLRSRIWGDDVLESQDKQQNDKSERGKDGKKERQRERLCECGRCVLKRQRDVYSLLIPSLRGLSQRKQLAYDFDAFLRAYIPNRMTTTTYLGTYLLSSSQIRLQDKPPLQQGRVPLISLFYLISPSFHSVCPAALD